MASKRSKFKSPAAFAKFLMIDSDEKHEAFKLGCSLLRKDTRFTGYYKELAEELAYYGLKMALWNEVGKLRKVGRNPDPQQRVNYAAKGIPGQYLNKNRAKLQAWMKNPYTKSYFLDNGKALGEATVGELRDAVNRYKVDIEGRLSTVKYWTRVVKECELKTTDPDAVIGELLTEDELRKLDM
jgi:hypothetical protein